MTQYPLIFTIKDWVQGPGFIAGVHVEGRVLMAQESDGLWWLNGVTPGGLAQSGATPNEAYLNFKEFFKGVLADLATEAGTFEAFQKSVEAFVLDSDTQEAALWTTARQALRDGTLKIEEPFSRMHKITEATPARLVECIRLDQPAAQVVSPDFEFTYQAAA